MAQQEKRRFVKWLLVALAACILVLGGAISAAALVAKQFRESEKIAAHVTVEGVAVGGMDAAAAHSAVSDQWVSTLPASIELAWPDGSTQVSREELGLELEIANAIREALSVGRRGSFISQIMDRLELARREANFRVSTTVDADRVRECVEQLSDEVDLEPRNADVRIDGDEVHVIRGKMGRRLDVEASARDLAVALEDPLTESFELVTRKLPPAISAEDLKHLEVVLARYTTRFRPWQKDRTHNLRLAIKNLGRAVVKPGDVLSFNQRVGPRLSEAGWRSAPIFIDGEVEPSTGGGICQVATTVYNAALLANLDVVERHHHSRPVDYAPAGRDATVYWGQYDLRVRNNLDHPILIAGGIGDDSLTIQVIGSRRDQCDVTITSSGVARISFQTKEQPDPELELDKREVEKPGRRGTRVTITRIAEKGGEVIRRERLHTDVYSPQTEVVRVGTKKPEVVLGPDGKPLPPGTILPPGQEPAKPGVGDAKPGAKPPAATPPPAARGHKASEAPSVVAGGHPED